MTILFEIVAALVIYGTLYLVLPLAALYTVIRVVKAALS